MTSIGIVVGILIAVGGWIASGVLARRDARRRLRVEYLLSAYRRLDAASNRVMGPTHEGDLESAISDVQLLGMPRQVELAEELARSFSQARSAETGPLLEDLRSTLRDELQLEAVPPRGIWLRITSDGAWAEEVAHVRAQVGVAPPDSPEPPTVIRADGGPVSPEHTIQVAYQSVVDALHELTAPQVSSATSDVDSLVRLARDSGLIGDGTAEAIEGLTVLHDLAQHGRHGTETNADEYLALVRATLYAMKRDAAREQTS